MEGIIGIIIGVTIGVLVSGEAASAEVGSHNVLFLGRTCVCDIGNKIRTERERERHKKVYLY